MISPAEAEAARARTFRDYSLAGTVLPPRRRAPTGDLALPAEEAGQCQGLLGRVLDERRAPRRWDRDRLRECRVHPWVVVLRLRAHGLLLPVRKRRRGLLDVEPRRVRVVLIRLDVGVW